MQRILTVLKYYGLILVLGLSLLGGASKAQALEAPEIQTKAALLMEAYSGQIIYQKNPDQELPMASVTKLMTLLLALEAEENHLIKLEDSITASEKAASMGGSQIYLAAGEVMSFRDLLISIAVGSANDACIAVAEHLQGDTEAFVQAMNQRAGELGLKQTHFANPTGLPAENHYSCAADLAVILQNCLQHSLFKEISGIYEYDLRGGEFKLWSTNKLLKWYEGVDAGKTGWTADSGFCLASTCQKDNLRLIAVVLGGETNGSHFAESIKLYDYGFANYQMLTLAKAGEKIKTAAVNKGAEEQVNLVLAEEVKLLTAKGTENNFQIKLESPEQVSAPVERNANLGWYLVYQEGKEVHKTALVAEKAVAKATLWQQLQRVWRSFF